MPQFAKVFQLGNFQVVRLPDDFRFEVDEVEVWCEGNALILRPRTDVSRRWISWGAATTRGVSDDFFAEGRQQPENQKRPDLDRTFLDLSILDQMSSPCW